MTDPQTQTTSDLIDKIPPKYRKAILVEIERLKMRNIDDVIKLGRVGWLRVPGIGRCHLNRILEALMEFGKEMSQ